MYIYMYRERERVSMKKKRNKRVENGQQNGGHQRAHVVIGTSRGNINDVDHRTSEYTNIQKYIHTLTIIVKMNKKYNE